MIIFPFVYLTTVWHGLLFLLMRLKLRVLEQLARSLRKTHLGTHSGSMNESRQALDKQVWPHKRVNKNIGRQTKVALNSLFSMMRSATFNITSSDMQFMLV